MLIHDLRYGLRLIRKAPGFTAVAIASLAVGIGASTVLFSFANSLLFRPLHAARPDEIVQLFTSDSDGGRFGGSSYADYEDFRAAPVFDGLLASIRASATLGDRERSEVINGVFVSGNYFDVLGLGASRGRFFRADENQTPGGHAVVVLSHDAWRRRFSADPAIVGRAIELNGRPFTVIGVGPPRFAGTSIERAADFFVPAMMQQALSEGTDTLHDRRARIVTVFGRMRSGISLEAANTALEVTAANLLRLDPVAWRDATGRGRVVTLMPERDARFVGAAPGSVVSIILAVIAGVVALLAIACVNVATLLVARASTRRKEIAVRLALGASRRQLVRQMLTECALLAAAAGVLGLMIAHGAAAVFARFRPDGVPPFDLTLDYRILLFSIGASLFTIVSFGLAPALQSTRPDVMTGLKDAARSVRLRGFRFGLRAGLVVVQVALSLAMMIGAALMFRSVHAGRTADPGFRRDGVISVGIDLSTVRDQNGAHARFFQEAVRSAAGLPGIERVALAALVPLDGSNSQTSIRIADGRSAVTVDPDINIVGPGYFALLDIPILRGREFTAADGPSAPPVAVVNDAMGRQYWHGDPLGKTFISEGTGEAVLIVGVVRDLRHRSFAEAPRPMVYFSADQRRRQRMTLHLRTKAPLAAITPAVQQTLHDIDRSAGLSTAETMGTFLDRVMMPQRLGAGAAVTVGVLELALAVMALYGVIAFAASQRRREIGLRVALGASSRSVVMLLMREGLVLTGAGVALGVGVALVAGAALQSLLIGVGPADAVSYLGAALALVFVAAGASYVPARRALSVDPSTALRSE